MDMSTLQPAVPARESPATPTPQQTLVNIGLLRVTVTPRAVIPATHTKPSHGKLFTGGPDRGACVGYGTVAKSAAAGHPTPPIAISLNPH